MARRILSVWFPRLAAEFVLRQEKGTLVGPFAIIATENNSQTLASLSAEAEAEGLRPGQPLRDARAFCPDLLTRPANPVAEATFLTRLRRWACRERRPSVLRSPVTARRRCRGRHRALTGGRRSRAMW